MRPSIFRRSGAALLLALFLPSCTDAPLSPAAPEGAGLPTWAAAPSGSQNPYQRAAEIGARASLQAIRDTEAARRQGRSGDALSRIAEASINRVLTAHGAPAHRFASMEGKARGRKVLESAALSEAQRRLVGAVMNASAALDPARVTPEEFDATLRAIELRARRELRGPDQQVVLLASATASAYYREYHPVARPGLAGVSRALTGPLDLGATFDECCSWGGMADSVAGGAINGAVAGAVAGWMSGGGYGLSIIGGALGGALGAGAQYAWDWYNEYS